MTGQIVRNIVKLLREYHMISAEQEEEYIYALVCMFETLIVTGSLLLISVFLGNTIPTIGFLLFFFSLRKRTGGFHVDTFTGCYMGTVIIYGLISGISVWLVQNMAVLIFLLFFSSVCILAIGTVNHPNLSMDKYELQSARNSGRLLLALQFVVIIFLIWIEADKNITVYLSLAVVLCAILLLAAKIIGQEVKADG